MIVTLNSDMIKCKYLQDYHELCEKRGVPIEVFPEDGSKFAELNCEADGVCIPYVRGVHTLSNGYPGYPPEGGYCEDVRLTVNKLDITNWLLETDRGWIEENLYDHYMLPNYDY